MLRQAPVERSCIIPGYNSFLLSDACLRQKEVFYNHSKREKGENSCKVANRVSRIQATMRLRLETDADNQTWRVINRCESSNPE